MRSIAVLLLFAITVAPAGAQERKSRGRGKEPPYPLLVTSDTRRDKKKLAALERPGRIVFTDGFESPKSFGKYFEIGGRTDGRAVLETDARLAHTGKGAIRLTAPARDGRSSGAGAHAWLGPKGYDQLYFRRYIKFAEDYDQGNLNHTGGGLAGVAGTGKWDGMGKAGLRPTGEDRFTSRLEPWRDWGRYSAPGYMFCYTYWMDMKPGRAEGQHWGNMLGPKKTERIVPERGRWVCLEQMIKVNTVGKADGELAAWIDGKLYLHYKGFRWRKTERLRLKRFSLDIYVHEARRQNVVWYDDVTLSTGYIGPLKRKVAR